MKRTLGLLVLLCLISSAVPVNSQERTLTDKEMVKFVEEFIFYQSVMSDIGDILASKNRHEKREFMLDLEKRNQRISDTTARMTPADRQQFADIIQQYFPVSRPQP